MRRPSADFTLHRLDPDSPIWLSRLPPRLRLGEAAFAALWQRHPAERDELALFGRRRRMRRWQQAYLRDYDYPGSRPAEARLPDALAPLLAWARAAIDERLDGVLVNWYDGALADGITRHRDRTRGLRPDAAIVTVSLGERRTFRLRPHRGPGFRDFELRDGEVMVLAPRTNERWTHEVPASRRLRGRRISVTLRAFAAP